MEKSLHVSQTGENWEVEDETQTLAQAETKAEAIEAAMDVARANKVEKIVVHTSDGGIEMAIPVVPKTAEERFTRPQGN